MKEYSLENFNKIKLNFFKLAIFYLCYFELCYFNICYFNPLPIEPDLTYGRVLKAYFSGKSKKTNTNLTNFFIFEILSLKEQQLFKRFAFFGTLSYCYEKLFLRKPQATRNGTKLS
ncbi:hypothetical protein BpHYR1_032000 [Brachionus plicatilis]|uniref:Uncharacterized protein n=1 Tax=Brachionus plicatilis TaxID=10195 RepID=A0A3M7SG36_BRAPC|nr:hypothetical protein BpHYR1_032000 [Brachionus plicatilis]